MIIKHQTDTVTKDCNMFGIDLGAQNAVPSICSNCHVKLKQAKEWHVSLHCEHMLRNCTPPINTYQLNDQKNGAQHPKGISKCLIAVTIKVGGIGVSI